MERAESGAGIDLLEELESLLCLRTGEVSKSLGEDLLRHKVLTLGKLQYVVNLRSALATVRGLQNVLAI